MEKLFVPIYLAISLKEKGFKEDCLGFYQIPFYSKEMSLYLHKVNSKELYPKKDTYLCPTHQQCVDWLRINHRIEVSSPCKKDKDLGVFYGGYVKKYDDDFGKSYGSNFRDYYEAYNHGIKEALKLI